MNHITPEQQHSLERLFVLANVVENGRNSPEYIKLCTEMKDVITAKEEVQVEFQEFLRAMREKYQVGEYDPRLLAAHAEQLSRTKQLLRRKLYTSVLYFTALIGFGVEIASLPFYHWMVAFVCIYIAIYTRP